MLLMSIGMVARENICVWVVTGNLQKVGLKADLASMDACSTQYSGGRDSVTIFF